MKLHAKGRSARARTNAACLGAACRLAIVALSLTGCAGLLPHSKQNIETPWRDYSDAAAMFARIIPGQTSLSDLKALGIDPERTPNVALLAHADLLRRLVGTSSFDMNLLDPRLRECVADHLNCFGVEIEQRHLERTRYGNFWLDFLNFDRKVDISGWQFDAVIVIRGDTVAYKFWSGKPSIRQFEREQNPLGPLQGIGPSMINR
jgi:hypothetical protein